MGCGETQKSPVAPEDGSLHQVVSYYRTSADGADQLGKALAQAMRYANVRSDLRDAMRSSRITEHKLNLQRYVASPSGARLIAGAAEVTGTTIGELKAIISGLPRMDLYVPIRQHRLTWQATADVVFATTMDVNAKVLNAYSPSGNRVIVDATEADPEFTVILLAPAERTSRRIRPQADVPGRVIQDEEDGDLSGSMVWTDSKGMRRIVELADLLGGGDVGISSECDPRTAKEPCDEGDGGGGGSGGAPADTTFLTHFKIFFDDGLSSSEVEFHATYSVDNHIDMLRFEGVGEEEDNYPDIPLIFRRILEGSSETINIHVTETDQLSDDDKGNRDFDVGDRAQVRSIYKDNSLTTNVTLDWTPRLQ